MPALRTFETVARHHSLTKAAQELDLTVSAVSHQLRKLENALGYALFHKAGRGIVLTEAGKVFARAVASALQTIFSTASSLSEIGRSGGRLNISCPPMFANEWLAHNIADFIKNYPAIECHIRMVENELITKQNSDMDVAILFGGGGWPDKWSQQLQPIQITPVCSPSLYHSAGKEFKCVTDLRDVTLLHSDDGSEWNRWLSSAGENDFNAYNHNFYCNDLSIAINMAISGAGIALVSDVLSFFHINNGALVRPYPLKIDALGSWYAICNPARLQYTAARLFLRWITGRFGIDKVNFRAHSEKCEAVFGKSVRKTR